MPLGSHQSQKSAWEEGIALGLLRELGDPDPPMNAFSLARLCGLRVEFADLAGARIEGKTIYVTAKARGVRQHGLVSHELGHWAIARAKERDGEAEASYVGAALMLPRATFDQDLRATAWDLQELRAKHVHCSAELIAKRICSMRDACVSIWDNGKLKERTASPWLPVAYRRVSRFERELAALALETGETQKAGELMWAFPVFSGWWKRVITVCEAEQLSLRL